MKGNVNIVVDTEGDFAQIAIRPKIENVDNVDKVFLLYAFCNALEIKESHIFTMLSTKDELAKTGGTYEIGKIK